MRFTYGLVLWALSISAMGSASENIFSSPVPSETVTVDAAAASRPFPHFWEKMFGSGRAILSLRESYRSDLRAVKKVTDFQYVRFHAIFHDEVGVYDEDASGQPVYNFTYVDQIYDGLLANGVRPFVELSFMPKKLAAQMDVHPFWYKQIVSPPKEYAKWDDLIRHFAQHLVDRYGIDEVSQWYFEVWNEPNIDFWTGTPKQSTYFELYEHTARALKAVNSRLRVGGPSTAAADWVDAFLDYAHRNQVPVDFVSTHAYADDTVDNLFHAPLNIPMEQRVCRAVKKVRDQISASAFPHLPLMLTEWSVPSYGPLHARDTSYVGAGLADDIWQCDGMVDMMSYWTFSDVFEESGVRHQPFDGGFGLMAAPGIKKPSLNGFALLHRLGEVRILNPAENILITRHDDGSLAIALWNLVPMDQTGQARQFKLQFKNLPADAAFLLTRSDADHGNSVAAYQAMGSPIYPTPAQVVELNRAADPGPPQKVSLLNGELTVDVPPNGLVLLEAAPKLEAHR